ncbi:MAG: LysM peptidoglycan-binding domain-containing protein [Candidatus Omnitrophica bacterium]|nr:LysM peptidoglycan-binding domain-containing protein [Candidatus Omnitrophota bacterium]
MPKSIIQGTILCALGLFLYGCGTSGIEMRTYAEDRPRVDQEIAGVDNQGYVGGSMQSGNIAERKKTRKVYVMEISRGTGNIKPVDEEETSVAGGASVAAEAQAGAPGAGAAVARFVEYTVEKDDTLQKIAKKFYDSYNKWPRISEANKSVLPNPDRLRPGMVLQIPQD